MTFSPDRDVWEDTQTNTIIGIATASACRRRRLQTALGIVAETPVNTMQLETLDCITAVSAGEKTAITIDGSAAKSDCQQTGRTVGLAGGIPDWLRCP